MKAWLKGGLIALSIVITLDILIALIVYLGHFVVGYSGFLDILWGIVVIPFFLAYMILVMFFNAPFDADVSKFVSGLWFSVTIILEALIIFLIGAVIGWIVSKIKSRK